jgi:hypothetical protein
MEACKVFEYKGLYKQTQDKMERRHPKQPPDKKLNKRITKLNEWYYQEHTWDGSEIRNILNDAFGEDGESMDRI